MKTIFSLRDLISIKYRIDRKLILLLAIVFCVMMDAVKGSRRTRTRRDDGEVEPTRAYQRSARYYGQIYDDLVSPCGTRSARGQRVDTGLVDVINSLGRTMDLLEETVWALGPTHCSSFEIHTLPSRPDLHTGQTLLEAVTEAHKSLVHIQVHLNFMQMDRVGESGPLCSNGTRRTRRSSKLQYTRDIFNHYATLHHKLKQLNCMLLNKVSDPFSLSGRLAENVNSAVDNQLWRYHSCHQKAVRDCLVLAYARRVIPQIRNSLLARQQSS